MRGSRGPVTLHPDPDRNLADGVVVETVLKARLLGLPVLRIHGVVLISPASGSRPPASGSRAPAAGSRFPTSTVETFPSSAAGTTGSSLAQARSLLLENGRRLRQLG